MSGRGPYSFWNVFGFRGRIGRRQFALSLVYQVILMLLSVLVLLAIGGRRLAEAAAAGLDDPSSLDLTDLYVPIAFAIISQVLLSVLTFTAMRSRLHDVGMSTWWTIPLCLPSLAALAGMLLYSGVNAGVLQTIGTDVTVLFVFLLAVLPGQPGTNAYGAPSPTRRASASTPVRHTGTRPTVSDASEA